MQKMSESNFVIQDMGDDISTKSCSEIIINGSEKFILNIKNIDNGQVTKFEHLELQGDYMQNQINLPRILEKIVKKYDIPKFLKHKKKLIKAKQKIENQIKKQQVQLGDSNLNSNFDQNSSSNFNSCLNSLQQQQDNLQQEQLQSSKGKNQYQQQAFQKILQEPEYLLKNKNIHIFDEISQKFVSLGQEPYLNMHIPFIREQFSKNNEGKNNQMEIQVQVSQKKEIGSSFSIYPQIAYEYQKKNGQNIDNKDIIEYILQDDLKSDDLGVKLSNKLRFLKYCQVVQQKTKKKMKNERRIKERTIQDVKNKVYQWRNIAIENRLSLEKAAEIIGISRKTLDDYCLQLRKGKDFGFDYVKNKHAKMGQLRQFVKEKLNGKCLSLVNMIGDETTKINSNLDEVSYYQNLSQTTQYQQEDINLYFNNNIQQNQQIQDRLEQPYLIRVETSMDYAIIEQQQQQKQQQEEVQEEEIDEELEVILKQIDDNKNRKYKKSRKNSQNEKNNRKNSSKKMSLCEIENIEKKVKIEVINQSAETKNEQFQQQQDNLQDFSHMQNQNNLINLEELGHFNINNMFNKQNNYDFNTSINQNENNLQQQNNRFIIQVPNNTNSNSYNNNCNNILSNSFNFNYCNNLNATNNNNNNINLNQSIFSQQKIQHENSQFQLQNSLNQQYFFNLEKSYQLNFN